MAGAFCIALRRCVLTELQFNKELSMALQIVRSRIGAADIVQVVEVQIGHLLGWLIPGATPDAVKEIEWLAAPYRNEDFTLNAVSQCFVVRLANRTIVLDTCIGNDKELPPLPEWSQMALPFLETLEEAGVDRFGVTDVLCTHLHFDHVGWNTYWHENEWHPTFPNARYHFARSEYEYWQRSSGQTTENSIQSISFDESVSPIVKAGLANFIETDADLGDGISVIPTPGHSPGHISLRIDSGGRSFVIAGDTMHHPCQIARPHWATETDFDREQSTATRRLFFRDLAGSGILVAGTHFCSPSFGTIEQGGDGDGYVFRPASG